MRQIVWSVEAENDFAENIEYLMREWTEEDAIEFIHKVNRIIETVRTELVRYQPANYKGLFKCVVCKQITLFYRENGIEEIELVRFWNNYRDLNNLKT
jgi:plasmid stabilization system protein ParE